MEQENKRKYELVFIIEIDTQLYHELEKLAKEKSQPVEKYIGNVLEEYIKNKRIYNE